MAWHSHHATSKLDDSPQHQNISSNTKQFNVQIERLMFCKAIRPNVPLFVCTVYDSTLRWAISRNATLFVCTLYCTRYHEYDQLLFVTWGGRGEIFWGIIWFTVGTEWVSVVTERVKRARGGGEEAIEFWMLMIGSLHWFSFAFPLFPHLSTIFSL